MVEALLVNGPVQQEVRTKEDLKEAIPVLTGPTEAD